jgi:TM2 domain-containing membrane protein YozV
MLRNPGGNAAAIAGVFHDAARGGIDDPAPYHSTNNDKWEGSMNYRAYNLELLSILKSVPSDKMDSFINRYNSQAKNPTVIFGFSVYLGSWGIDRFLLGHTLLGILKLITLGGLGIWTIVDWFLVGGIARDKNIELAREIAKSSGP